MPDLAFDKLDNRPNPNVVLYDHGSDLSVVWPDTQLILSELPPSDREVRGWSFGGLAYWGDAIEVTTREGRPKFCVVRVARGDPILLRGATFREALGLLGIRPMTVRGGHESEPGCRGYTHPGVAKRLLRQIWDANESGKGPLTLRHTSKRATVLMEMASNVIPQEQSTVYSGYHLQGPWVVILAKP